MKEKTTESKIEHLWTIICGSSSVDTDTNSLSLFNIIEEITIQNVPGQSMNLNDKKGIPIPFEVVSCILRSQESDGKSIFVDLKIDFLDPDNKILQTVNSKVEIKSQHSRLRVRIKANGITITKPGIYNLLVSMKEDSEKELKEVIKVPLIVKMPIPTDLNILKK